MPVTRARKSSVPNPFDRFAGQKQDLYTAGAVIRSWDYRRASKDDHKLAKSVSDQGTDNTRHEERHGWTHIATFEDNDLGASRQAKARGVVREGFQRLLTAIRNGEPGDVLVMWEIARRERDLAVFVEIRDLCIEYGPFFWLVGGELYDVRNRHDRSYLGNQAQQAESGADAIEEGTRRGLAANAEEGKPQGQASFGYRRVYHPRTRKYVEQVPDLDTSYTDDAGNRVERIDAYGRLWSPAEVMQGMYEDALALMPLHRIVTGLNQRGIPTPRLLASVEQATPKGPERWMGTVWSQNVVRRLLLNPANIGARLTHGKIAKPGSWPEMVAPELFYSLAIELTEPSRTNNPYMGQSARALYPLTHITRCWVCKAVVQFMAGKGRGAGYKPRGAVYKCINNCATIPQSLIEETVEAAVIYRLSDPGELGAVLALDSNAPEIQAARAEVARLRVDLADTKRRMRSALTADMDDLEFRRDEQRRRLAAAEARMTSTDLPPELTQFVGTTLVEAEELWRTLLLPVKRAIIRILVDVWIFPAGRGRARVPLDERLFIESVARVGPSRAAAWGARCAAAREARAAHRSPPAGSLER